MDDSKSDRRVWTEAEDDAIRKLVAIYGGKTWTVIAEKISSDYGVYNRSGKQCRERWHNHLDPSINKMPWSYEEEEIMASAHRVLGNKWSEIAVKLPGRTDNQIKNHWYSFVRKSNRKSSRLEEPGTASHSNSGSYTSTDSNYHNSTSMIHVNTAITSVARNTSTSDSDSDSDSEDDDIATAAASAAAICADNRPNKRSR